MGLKQVLYDGFLYINNSSLLYPFRLDSRYICTQRWKESVTVSSASRPCGSRSTALDVSLLLGTRASSMVSVVGGLETS